MSDSLLNKVDFLSDPSNYHDRTMSVDVIETHMSWLFLTDRFAYKMKKPVAYDYLDFSTLEARGHYCEEEVRLNRRLAAHVYLGVMPVLLDAWGKLRLYGEGVVTEWLIKMHRLPSNKTLDHCILNRCIPEHSLQSLIEKLSRFYLACTPEPMSAEQYRDRFARRIDEVSTELMSAEFDMPKDAIHAVVQKMKEFLTTQGGLLEQRVHAGKIIEGHGDLRAEHVYLEAEPVIVDCLEFSKDLRTVDAAYDMSFLVLECERLGAPVVGDELFRLYREMTGDDPASALVHFYQTYHACSRARLALWHLREAQYQNSPKWSQQAYEWLNLAQTHAVLCR